MAKALAKNLDGYFVPEWAREYLETLPTPETTDERMADIVAGQRALQKAAAALDNKAWIFQDTDLLSTVGYYHIFGGAERRSYDLEQCQRAFKMTKSDMYVVMDDSIPFEKDLLRYGDGVRQSTQKFWIDLLEKNNCQYIVVPPGLSHEVQLQWVEGELLSWFAESVADIVNFKR
jgi:nicotinamide riboside kinase